MKKHFLGKKLRADAMKLFRLKNSDFLQDLWEILLMVRVLVPSLAGICRFRLFY